MVLYHRKLLYRYLPKEDFPTRLYCCESYSEKYWICSCLGDAFHLTSSSKDETLLDSLNEKHNNVVGIIIILACVIGGGLLLQLLFALLCCVMKRARASQVLASDARREDLLDEDRGPEITHHIWHIRTSGLQPSVINSITVFKYRRDEGLIEGTECSVCLNEFQEDESLRLLPKCSHAFHVDCIDTWLRSHKNCPLCRAPIVFNKNAARPESHSSNWGSRTESEVESSGNIVGEASGNDGEGESASVGNGNRQTLPNENARSPGYPSRVLSDLASTRGENVEPMRRSASMGCSLQKQPELGSSKRAFLSRIKLFASTSARMQDPVLPS